MFSFDTPESPGGLFINLCTFQVRRCSRHDSGGAGDFEWELSGRRTDQQHLFQAFGESFVELDHQRTGQVVYLHVKWTRVPVEAPPTGSEAAAAPTKLAIGVPGGFAVHDGSGGQTTLVKEHALVVFPGRQTCPYPHSELPISVTLAVDAVLAHADVAVSDTVTAWEEERRVSKYAVGLVLEDSTGRKVSRDMRQWLDQETGATDNLWLNLSDGYIGGGRRNWDGTGGSGSALRHFQAMQAQGKFYPLVVKLGTITPSGADVYSYAPDEDDMVTDPQLGDHLAHWGIDVMQCEKTEKSMAEMEIALNSTFEFDKIMESGAQLQPVSGPGFTGLYNLGNSCYMNSLLQVLKELPEFGAAHAAIAADGAIFRAAPAQPSDDLRVQMAKLAAGLLLPCPHDASRTAIRPGRFKALIAKGHREWSSSRQQDVADYLERVLTVLDDTIPTSGSALFQFDVENRDESTASGACRYSHARESVLRLYIPLDAAENLDDVAAFKERQAKRQKLRAEGATAYIAAGQPPNSNDAMEVGDTAGAVSADVEETPVPPVVPFSACMARYVSVPLDSMAVGPGNKRGPGMRTVRFATMPRYLALQMNRFDITPGSWVPHKVDVLVAPPQRLSLEHLRAKPHPPNELLLPQLDDDAAAAGPAAAAAAPPPVDEAPVLPDETIVAQLVSMGFSENGSRRAAVATRNAGAEASMNWVLSHMDDVDFNEPLPQAAPASTTGGRAKVTADASLVEQLTAFGFPARAAKAALLACDNNVERAADWLLTRDDLDAAVAAAETAAAAPSTAPQQQQQPKEAAAVSGSAAAAQLPLDDGPGEYELVGFVSHMGANTSCGHYVAHVLKHGKWVLYNDEKVAFSQAAPLELGYLYIYRRL